MIKAWIEKYGITEGEIFRVLDLGELRFKVIEGMLLEKDEGRWEVCCIPVYEFANRIPTPIFTK